MFYESIGAQLSRAAEALAADDPRVPVDERGQRERRATVRLLRRIGVIWPSLFCALNEECAILETTRRRAAEAARAQHVAPRDERASGVPERAERDDPLARYRRLHYELDALVILLHEHGREPWAQDTLRSLRRGLADAAEVQGRVVDAMLEA